MDAGAVKSITAFYEKNVLIHISMQSLVLTLIGKAGKINNGVCIDFQPI